MKRAYLRKCHAHRLLFKNLSSGRITPKTVAWQKTKQNAQKQNIIYIKKRWDRDSYTREVSKT